MLQIATSILGHDFTSTKEILSTSDVHHKIIHFLVVLVAKGQQSSDPDVQHRLSSILLQYLSIPSSFTRYCNRSYIAELCGVMHTPCCHFFSNQIFWWWLVLIALSHSRTALRRFRRICCKLGSTAQTLAIKDFSIHFGRRDLFWGTYKSTWSAQDSRIESFL